MNNTSAKIAIVGVVAALIAVVFVLKQNDEIASPDGGGEGVASSSVPGATTEPREAQSPQPTAALPRLVDLGADKCIPCKMMAPILEELKKEYAGRLRVDFIDVWKDPSAGKTYGIKLIPTQIFYDASGQELFRHEGFLSKEDILAKWKAFGVDLPDGTSREPAFERLTPAAVDDRPGDSICYLCDGDIHEKTLVTVQTAKGPVRLCSPHCYFIMHSCLTEDKADFEQRVSVADWGTGDAVPATSAVFLCGQDENTGRPWIKAFAERADAVTERAGGGGSVFALEALQQKELSHRCGFCDRACYPQDAAEVIVAGGLRTWGCCSHCALGVTARTGKDIEVREKDRLTGEPVVVKTFEGKIASLEPSTAVAWFGQRQKPDGTWGSAGCFHQGFFTSADHLRSWVEKNPHETGRLISIHQALANKMKLSPEQIKKACKIGECSPK